jgi:hypothetical protein
MTFETGTQPWLKLQLSRESACLKFVGENGCHVFVLQFVLLRVIILDPDHFGANHSIHNNDLDLKGTHAQRDCANLIEKFIDFFGAAQAVCDLLTINDSSLLLPIVKDLAFSHLSCIKCRLLQEFDELI